PAPRSFSGVGPDRRMPFPLHRSHQLEVRRLLDQSDEPRAHAPAGSCHHDPDLPLPFHHPSLRKTTPPLRINSNPPHSPHPDLASLFLEKPSAGDTAWVPGLPVAPGMQPVHSVGRTAGSAGPR